MKGSGLLFNSSSYVELFLNVGILAVSLYVIWGVIYPRYKRNIFFKIVLSLVTIWLVYYHSTELMALISIPISYFIRPS